MVVPLNKRIRIEKDYATTLNPWGRLLHTFCATCKTYYQDMSRDFISHTYHDVFSTAVAVFSPSYKYQNT